MTSTGRLEDIGPDVLSKLAVEWPRLMATKSAIKRTRQSLHQSDTARQWYGEVEKQAKVLLDLPPLTLTWEHVNAGGKMHQRAGVKLHQDGMPKVFIGGLLLGDKQDEKRVASPENVTQASSVASPPMFPLPH